MRPCFTQNSKVHKGDTTGQSVSKRFLRKHLSGKNSVVHTSRKTSPFRCRSTVDSDQSAQECLQQRSEVTMQPTNISLKTRAASPKHIKPLPATPMTILYEPRRTCYEKFGYHFHQFKCIVLGLIPAKERTHVVSQLALHCLKAHALTPGEEMRAAPTLHWLHKRLE